MAAIDSELSANNFNNDHRVFWPEYLLVDSTVDVVVVPSCELGIKVVKNLSKLTRSGRAC